MTTDREALRKVLDELDTIKAEIAAEAKEEAARSALVSGDLGILPDVMSRAARAAGAMGWVFEQELVRLDSWRILPVEGVDAWVGCPVSPHRLDHPGERLFEAAVVECDPAADHWDEDVPDAVVEEAAVVSIDWDRYFAELAMPGEWKRRQLVRGRVIRDIRG